MQESKFPAVLEGANTTNLAQMLGIPYVSVSTQTTPYIPLETDKSHEQLSTVTSYLNKEKLTEGELKPVADYFNDAATNRSKALDGYFEKLKQYVRHETNDQLKLGLYRLAKALNLP